MTTVAVAVDARELSGTLFPEDDVGTFVRYWADLEALLQGRSVRAGDRLSVQVEDGPLVVEILTPAERIGPQTLFSVVAVRERPIVGKAYRCGTCHHRYGPFICSRCPKESQRVCDQDVVLLPGSLDGTCPQHRPVCQECGQPADVRCPGPRCGGRRGWCTPHTRTHSSNPDTAYCADCLTELFPPCGVDRCPGVGSIECDHLDPTGQRCPARRCPRHGRRWQVFGPHEQGLGRCDAHANLQGLSPDGLLYQVLGACTARGHRPPTLPSLRHMLMKVTMRQRSIGDVLQLSLATPHTAPALHRELDRLVDSVRRRWTAAAASAAGDLDEYTRQLLEWLYRAGNHQAAESLVGTGWARPRDGRPGKLFVRCDPRLLSRAWRDAASAALGFEVRLERNA
jgi:hypothetical protein